MKFSIRELMLVTMIAAVFFGWTVDRGRSEAEHDKLQLQFHQQSAEARAEQKMREQLESQLRRELARAKARTKELQELEASLYDLALPASKWLLQERCGVAWASQQLAEKDAVRDVAAIKDGIASKDGENTR